MEKYVVNKQDISLVPQAYKELLFRHKGGIVAKDANEFFEAYSSVLIDNIVYLKGSGGVVDTLHEDDFYIAEGGKKHHRLIMCVDAYIEAGEILKNRYGFRTSSNI